MLYLIGQDSIYSVLLLCPWLPLCPQPLPPSPPINAPHNQFDPVLLPARILWGQKLFDPVELLLHGLGNGSPIGAADTRIAQGDDHPLSRLAFAVAVGFEQLKHLAALGMLEPEKHIGAVWSGPVGKSRTTHIYSPYETYLTLCLVANQRLTKSHAI